MKVKHKNQIFATIQKSEISIDRFEFILNQEDSNQNVYITYKEDGVNSPLKFNIKQSLESYDDFKCCGIVYSPMMNYSQIFPANYFEYTDIGNVCEKLTDWINSSLKEYISDRLEVDLWDEYRKGNTLLKINQSESSDDSFFSLGEKQQIKLALNDLKLLIPQQFDINPLQLESINQRLEYLAEGLDRLNKFDWKSILVSQLLSVGTTLALNPDQFNHLRDLFIKLLHIIPLLN